VLCTVRCFFNAKSYSQKKIVLIAKGSQLSCNICIFSTLVHLFFFPFSLSFAI
jgi:hypothetical protein